MLLRSKLSTQRADEDRRRAGAHVEPHPDGSARGPAAVEFLARAFFGRPDVAAGIEVPAGTRIQFTGSARDAFGRLCGVRGVGVDPWQLYRGLLKSAGGSIMTGPASGRIELSAVGAASGALAFAQQAAAVRDALDEIVAFDWPRSGVFWMAATRLIPAPDMRARRYWLAASGVMENDEVPESGEGVRSPDGGSSGWLYADLQVTNEHRPTILLSFERWLNNGGMELSAWISGRLRLWHDSLDQEVAALLTGSAVRTNPGMFDAAHFASAVSAINRQTIGGAPLGSSRPVALCGENRRAFMSAVPGPARATGDEAAVLSRVVYSASVDPDFLALVHPQFMPAALAYLGQLEPRAVLGPYAGVRSAGRGNSDAGACVYQHRSVPGLVLDDAGKAVGVVRMTL